MNKDLSVRVDRLLHTTRLRQQAPKRSRAILAVAAIAVACATFVVLLEPETLHSVHELLEVLTH